MHELFTHPGLRPLALLLLVLAWIVAVAGVVHLVEVGLDWRAERRRRLQDQRWRQIEHELRARGFRRAA